MAAPALAVDLRSETVPTAFGAKVAGADWTAIKRAFANAEIVTVRSLDDDDAAGTLRHALARDANAAPCVIVFAVSGEITLSRALEIRSPRVWIAGQTAPRGPGGAGGITLTGHPLIVRAGTVAVEHLRVRPGPAEPGRGDVQDGVRIGASVSGDIADIVLRHLSVSWTADELLAIAPRMGETIRRMSVTDCLFAQPLLDGGHPRGAHNYGVYLRRGARQVLLARNVMSGATRRMPTLEQASSAALVDNVLSNWGSKPPVHAIFRDDLGAAYGDLGIALTAIGNSASAGPQTPAKTANVFLSPFAERPKGFDGRSPLTAFLADNVLNGEAVAPPRPRPWIDIAETAPIAIPGDEPRLGRKALLAGAGAWPAARDPIDRDIARTVAEGRDHWIERPPPSPPPSPIYGEPMLPAPEKTLLARVEAASAALGGVVPQ